MTDQDTLDRLDRLDTISRQEEVIRAADELAEAVSHVLGNRTPIQASDLVWDAFGVYRAVRNRVDL